jgi:hypothetical protein
MRFPSHIVSTLPLATSGGFVGYFFGCYQVAASIAHMKEQWGWVCATGLDFHLYFWSFIGVLVGALAGVLARLFAFRYVRDRGASA